MQNLTQIKEMLEVAEELREKVKFMVNATDVSVEDKFRLKNIKSDLAGIINSLQAKTIQEVSKLADLKNGNTGVGGPYTLEETGLVLGGVTRERVRQIEAQAIKKIKHPRIVRKFYDYVKEIS
ncbi:MULTISPECIES: sigma factor-like helix-turn-helix DNA-binding protein [unclassified Campylobacter]|uniref:sigma factor-like helix-turn-helix DNA-binding protein n=1 Tax=unclassified Campylobacter TaxID=2593542 RepID=UPI001476121A|nr:MULTISPECIES: sigma factor-like helix-turn-helix DNA-binding protein [unclassified Campylobacter]